ncbi:hypothetical protein GCM10007972_08980 [Iodidimonas muriae]|uniref:DUF481 domain-containing protein n=1 Tax=Iodidimonas muriae TaxID=261467 RepID=A0ABQ2LAV9_9PROT|nr:DUF481 domain-containing protein [Iodidimonas muriae]GER06170.1 hypothetical protein JCM17843_04800 [Kordiimonadales bacterium JCM 17843]GGO08528.1 hypothetical protein GCM10007972_08980 [Iodidimonas muriae]
MSRASLFALLSTLPLLISNPAVADRVHLADGSLIEGTLVEAAGGRLRFETTFAGVIEIDLEALAGLESDHIVIVSLASGDRLVGRLAFDKQQGQGLSSASLGRLSIRFDDVAALWLEGAQSPEELALQEIEEAQARQIAELEEQHSQEVAQLETALVTPEKAWSGRTQLGLSGARGNTDRVALNGKASTRRETDFDRLDLSLGWRFARENGKETENEVIGETRLERDFSESWFAFGGLVLEQDEFEDLDLRSVLTAGTGVFFIQEEKQQLKARFGIGYQVEAFQNAPNEEEAILSLGYEYRIQLNGRLLFTHDLIYLPSFNDPVDDFRVESNAALDIPVTESKAWSVRIGVRNQYDNTPVSGNEKLDTFYTLSLGYNFQ